MSISSSMSSALSGLSAAARAAEVVSSNVANAMTEGYGRREIILTSATTGAAGVAVEGVRRSEDLGIISDRRRAEAGLSLSLTHSTTLARIETQIGLPTDAGSLSDRVARFDSSLIEAASHPESAARHTSVVRNAQDIAETLNNISDVIQTERKTADTTIGQEVTRLNNALVQLEELNASVFRFSNSGRDTNGLMDERRLVVDEIARIVPIQQVDRQNGTIALFTPGGAVLIDGVAAEFEFQPAGMIVPEMSLASGALSGLTMNGQSISTSPTHGPMAGGRLAALFEVRDQIAPDAQSDLDAIARDFIERFQDPAVDPTLSATDPGMFTDRGLGIDPALEEGLAGRIAVNAAIVPEEGGAAWRIRDGLNAVAPGEVGDATLINALSIALGADRAPASGSSAGVNRTAGDLVSDYLSSISSNRQIAEQDQVFSQSRVQTLMNQELQGGVDTDQELQKLLLIEQTYGANARVVQTLDELLDLIMRL
ncbi:MAG: flagellar hook-associated protein 1 FlgK [Paracoccaceae bacterium]|jgi:flagellar hook-associated protein 1 FlgK